MTFAEARAALAALEVNPLATSPAQQFRFCVKDFGEILDKLEAEVERDADRRLAEIYKLDSEKGIARTECLTAEMERDAALAKLAAAKRYAERNPLGGPAAIFDAMADRVRAGEPFDAVLKDYGFAKASPSYCPKCGKPVTACCEMEEIGE